MTRIVISQPMFLPWAGLFDQMRLADIFVHYDDVQLPQGRSFMSRVQILRGGAQAWLTAPLDRKNSGTLISQTRLSSHSDWRRSHLSSLRHSLAQAPRAAEALDLAERIYDNPAQFLSEFNIAALEEIAGTLGLTPRFVRSSDLEIGGRGTERLVALCAALGAHTYLTGHGARNYIDPAAFEAADIALCYIDYDFIAWPQNAAEFVPHVTVLDLIAGVGAENASSHLSSSTVSWRDFHSRRAGGMGP